MIQAYTQALQDDQGDHKHEVMWKIERVPTDDNVADPFIKVLAQNKFEHHLESMGIRYMGDWL